MHCISYIAFPIDKFVHCILKLYMDILYFKVVHGYIVFRTLHFGFDRHCIGTSYFESRTLHFGLDNKVVHSFNMGYAYSIFLYVLYF